MRTKSDVVTWLEIREFSLGSGDQTTITFSIGSERLGLCLEIIRDAVMSLPQLRIVEILEIVSVFARHGDMRYGALR